MKFTLLFITACLLCQVVNAQNGASTYTLSEATITTSTSTIPSTTVTPTASTPTGEAPQTSYLDYKSVYEAATLEEEVKMASERFTLTPSQQEMWLKAATDRRIVEQQSRDRLASKDATYEKENIYRGLRSAQSTFFETVTGYLTPNQKQAMDTDRQILEEKRQRIAKLPPPPPPAPTVAPVDSSAIKAAEKEKAGSKKSKKKKR